MVAPVEIIIRSRLFTFLKILAVQDFTFLISGCLAFVFPFGASWLLE